MGKGVLRGLIYIELPVFQKRSTTSSLDLTLQETKISMKLVKSQKYILIGNSCITLEIINKQNNNNEENIFFSDYEIKHRVNCNLYQTLPQLTKVYIPEVMYITTSKGFT